MQLADSSVAHPVSDDETGPPPLVSDSFFKYRVGILANKDHCIVRLTVQNLLSKNIVPVFVVEDEGTEKLRAKTAWYNEIYEKKRGSLPSVVDILESYEATTVHCTVSNINRPECIDFMKKHPVDILILANTRIVKPVVLSVPTITTMNAHAAYLPNHHPAHASPSPGGYMKGAMPFIYAIDRNEPIAVTVHHVLEELDAGEIVDSMRLNIHKGDMMEDVLCKVVDVTAELWLRTMLHWNGTTKGIKQDPSLLLEENKVPVRALAGDDLSLAMKKGDAILKEGSYKWYWPQYV